MKEYLSGDGSLCLFLDVGSCINDGCVIIKYLVLRGNMEISKEHINDNTSETD